MHDEPYIEAYTMGRMPMSYTQQIDRSVNISEMPYGYDTPPPPADHENPASRTQMYKHHKQRS